MCELIKAGEVVVSNIGRRTLVDADSLQSLIAAFPRSRCRRN